MSDDASTRHRPLVDALGAAVLDGPGVLAPDVRRSAAGNEGVPAPYTAFVDAIHRHAYRITDDDVAGLRSAGADQDGVFEITVAAAYGAAIERFRAGLRALGEIEGGT